MSGTTRSVVPRPTRPRSACRSVSAAPVLPPPHFCASSASVIVAGSLGGSVARMRRLRWCSGHIAWSRCAPRSPRLGGPVVVLGRGAASRPGRPARVCPIILGNISRAAKLPTTFTATSPGQLGWPLREGQGTRPPRRVPAYSITEQAVKGYRSPTTSHFSLESRNSSQLSPKRPSQFKIASVALEV